MSVSVQSDIVTPPGNGSSTVTDLSKHPIVSNYSIITVSNSIPDGSREQDPRAAPRRRGAQERHKERPKEEGLLRQQRVWRQEGKESEEGAETQNGLERDLDGLGHHEDAVKATGTLFSAVMRLHITVLS